MWSAKLGFLKFGFGYGSNKDKKRAQLLRDQSLLLEVSLYAVHLHAVLLEPQNQEAKYPYLTILIYYTLTPIRSAVFWSMRNGYTESKLPKTPFISQTLRSRVLQ